MRQTNERLDNRAGERTNDATRQLVDGAARGFAAEALLLPTGLVTASVLARVLGPEGYGTFALVMSISGWVTYSTSALLGRASVRVISEAASWASAAAYVLRARIIIGALAAIIMLGFAVLARTLFDAPRISDLLAVLSLDVVLFNVARAYREALTGIGRYRELAMVSAVRWIVRMVLIVALVLSTRSILAAAIASVLATLVECVLATRFVTIPWTRTTVTAPPALWRTAMSLVVYGLAFQMQTRVDLFAVTSLGRTAETARDIGWYSAAQNLSVVPGLFMLTVAPLLLATLGRLQRNQRGDEAKQLAQSTLRATIGFASLSAVVASCAAPIVSLIYGPAFAGAAELLVPLFVAGQCLAIAAVCTSILTAADRADRVSWLGVVLLAPAVIGHAVVVPRFGAHGAALVTLGTAFVTSLVAVALVVRTWPMPVVSDIFRTAALAGVLYVVGVQVQTTQWWTLAGKLLALSALLAAGLLALRLISFDSLRRAR